MELVRGKGLIIKTWERWRAFGGGGGGSNSSSGGLRRALVRKSKSWPRLRQKKRGKKCRVAPEGCFSVYVGQEKQRFVIKTEYVNHPLFKVLLEEAESEYGYYSEGPLVLPCDVDLFLKLLVEMDGHDDGDEVIHQGGCSTTFYRSYSSSYHLLS